LLWAEGGNDLIAIKFHLSVESITWFMRFAIFIGPVIAFIITRRWAISLQRHDRDLLLHGYETGVIVRSPDGGYSELHAPINQARAYALTTQPRHPVLEPPPKVDGSGVRAPQARSERLRARLSHFWYADEIQKPTAAELEAAAHHHSVDGPMIEDGHHAGIETVGQVGGDEFDLEETSTPTS
jgi:quinol---cytochrome-c reductase cytochrome b subunit